MRVVVVVVVRFFALFAVDLQDFQLGLADEHVGRVDFAIEEAHAEHVLVEIVDEKLHGRVPFRICRVDRVCAELLVRAQTHLAKHAFTKNQSQKFNSNLSIWTIKFLKSSIRKFLFKLNTGKLIKLKFKAVSSLFFSNLTTFSLINKKEKKANSFVTSFVRFGQYVLGLHDQ